ncbi:hypothetical protein [Planomicrobium sp. MB-3u-38]|uniref:hypothetical protein n=1 Tax=Planomicrobium sp. MB-3u-38 TaxID=2058318 RepID=UPI000C7C9ABB|nr:hypothetical protein [Planomicrobium sp. MB-3u-38]PKH11727.1 hypothetical protein CXF70_03270 [Planomicrobium sp. MB-3u-38]
MKKIYVDIYHQYWDVEEMKPVETVLINSNDYNSSVYNSFLEEELHNMLSTVKGDGYFIKIERTPKEEYINIVLVATKEDEMSSEYIHEFFENISKGREPSLEKNFNNNKEVPLYNGAEESGSKVQIYISLEFFDEEEVEELARLFNSKNFEAQLISNETVIYEKGASSVYFNFILEVSTLIGGISGIYALIQAYKNKSGQSHKNINAGQIDWESIKEQVSQFTGINTSDLRGTRFEINEPFIEVVLSNRYKEVIVLCDENFKVIKLHTVNKSQTVI